MNTMAIATALRALSRSCFPALGPTPLDAQGTVRNRIDAKLASKTVEELVPLGLQSNFNPVITRIDHVRVGGAGTHAETWDRRDLPLDLLDIGVDVVPYGNLVPSWADLDLRGSRVGWTRIGPSSSHLLRVFCITKSRTQLVAGRIIECTHFLHPDDEPAVVGAVLHLHHVGIVIAKRRHRASHHPGVDRLAKRDLDLGPSTEIGAIVGTWHEDQDSRDED